MALSAGLIIKGLLGAGVTCTAITCIVKKDDIHNWLYGIEEKKKSLNLPSKCEWPTEAGTPKECTELTGENLKVINFDGKGDTDLTVEPSSVTPAPTATLTIEKVSDSDFPQGYKFTFKTTGENGITLKKENTPVVTLKKDIGIDFKIKEDGGKWSLEKAWDVDKLGKNVGLVECTKTDTNKKCTFKANQKINVIDSSNKKITDLKVSADNSDISYDVDQKDYNQGIKFTIGSTAVSLSGGNAETGVTPPTQLQASQKYQIIKDGDKWYLSQKT